MKRKPEYDRGLDARGEALATALTNYANGNLEELKRLCQAVWPACDFYRGGTHIRVLIEGTSDGKSFYIET